MLQLNQAKIGGVLSNLRTIDGSSLKNGLTILNNILGEPCQVTLSGTVISVGASEYQTVESDTEYTTKNKDLKIAGIHSGKYVSVAASTLDVSDGSVSGDFAADTSPSITASHYITLAIELRSSDKKWHVTFGTSNADKATARAEANIAKFSNSSVVKRAILVLQKNGSTGQWGLTTPAVTDLRVLPLGSGGAGSGTDLVPIYKDGTDFTIQSSNGQKVRLNNKYYYLTSDLDVSYNVSADGTWYICVDTAEAEGEIVAGHVVLTQTGPSSASFNSNYCVIGEYVVSGAAVAADAVNGYSMREMVSWVNGLPNIKVASEQQTSTGSKTLTTSFGYAPSSVTYRYWDNSESKFYDFARKDIETEYTLTTITYEIPAADPIITFDAGDYFEVEAMYYNYIGDGFASPKSDDSTGWYSSTPADTVSHSLGSRPLAITLEYNDSGIYYTEDGMTYVDKSTGGIEGTQVTFDWSGLPVLSASLQMKIHFHKSKLSAGAFEASSTERGTVTVSGGSYAETPDLVLDATHTTFATQVNAVGNNKTVLVKESITVTTEQNLTVTGLKWRMLPGVYIICATNLAASGIIKFSGADYEIDDIRIESQEDIQTALKLNASGSVKNVLVKQNASGKTLTNAVEVVTGNIVICDGRARAVDGTISNKISDVDGNSEIRIA